MRVHGGRASVPAGARLLFRVDPLPHESPRGYLCRVAQEHGYGGPLLLAQIARLSPSALELEGSVKQISHMLRLEPEEWQAICYCHIKGRGRFCERSFHGERISADDLNYGRPRACPACLRERPIWWAVWDLGLVTACPIHRCFLLNQCPACKRKLGWQRPVTGYLFPSEDLRKHRPVQDITAPPDGFLNYSEAATVLGVKTPLIRGLVTQKIVGAPVGYRNGLSKLLPAAEIQGFAEKYMPLTVLAMRLGLRGRLLAHSLKRSGIPLLEVPVPDNERGHALFLPKEQLCAIKA